MKKGRSSRSSRSFALPKSIILRGRKNFKRLFEESADVFGNANLNIRFRLYPADEPDCKMAFIVPKRLGKAVERNRMKRLLKEAYRLNQYFLTDEVAESTVTFHGAFMAKTVEMEYDEVEVEVKSLLERVKDYILENY